MDLKEVHASGVDIDSHWYYRSKAEALARYLDRLQISKILDVGAGSGFFSRYLLRITSAQSACCIDINYESDRSELIDGKKIFFSNEIDDTEANLVLFMDVLEHVEDDAGFLKIYIDKVAPGTNFLITVPAFDFLWSSHDEFLGHYRRYSILEIERLIKISGLEVICSSYYFGLVFPIASAIRLLEKFNQTNMQPKLGLRNHSFLVNFILRLLCKLEIIFFKFNRIAGLTIFCLAKKI